MCVTYPLLAPKSAIVKVSVCTFCHDKSKSNRWHFRKLHGITSPPPTSYSPESHNISPTTEWKKEDSPAYSPERTRRELPFPFPLLLLLCLFCTGSYLSPPLPGIDYSWDRISSILWFGTARGCTFRVRGGGNGVFFVSRVVCFAGEVLL